jgi:hypothetical protein
MGDYYVRYNGQRTHDQGKIHLNLIMTTAQGRHIQLTLHRLACTHRAKLTPDFIDWLPHLPLAN